MFGHERKIQGSDVLLLLLLLLLDLGTFRVLVPVVRTSLVAMLGIESRGRVASIGVFLGVAPDRHHRRLCGFRSAEEGAHVELSRLFLELSSPKQCHSDGTLQFLSLPMPKMFEFVPSITGFCLEFVPPMRAHGFGHRFDGSTQSRRRLFDLGALQSRQLHLGRRSHGP